MIERVIAHMAKDPAMCKEMCDLIITSRFEPVLRIAYWVDAYCVLSTLLEYTNL